MSGPIKIVDGDDSSSDVSFEEVELKGSSQNLVIKDWDSSRDTAKDGNVPDILYVVHYVDSSSRLIKTRKGDKPHDIGPADAEDEDSEKRPVIEIVTTVTEGGSPNISVPRSIYDSCGRRIRRPDDDYNDYPDRARGNRTGNSHMIIHSKQLKNALSAVVSYYPGVDFLSSHVTITAPYHVLVHHYKELELYKVQQPRTHDKDYEETTIKHIDVLLSFLKTSVGAKIEAEKARWCGSTPKATFEYYWLLMKPGEVIYQKEDNHWTPYVVGSLWENSDGSRTTYNVNCWNIEFVEGRMQRIMKRIDIQAFYGEQAIHTLPVIPARFFPGGEKANAEKKIKLGKMYWELTKRPGYKEYDGVIVARDGMQGGNISGRVIVDADGYDRFGPNEDRNVPQIKVRPPPLRNSRGGYLHAPGSNPAKDQLPALKPRCTCAACSKQRGAREEELGPFAGFEDIDPNKDSPPNNDLYFLAMVDTIPAFVLGERRWAFVKVEGLKEVKPDREAFKYLVLDEEIKLTVKSLIGKFASSDGKVSPWPNDFVKGKGEGRIFLLHGSPGVGKTCTAECVAELTHRPLLSLTSGDISTSMSASSVERNLNYFLQLGVRYGALVLIDEADVYLEERRTKDLQRNGLVSIFLRALEYYKGVLFLTTNRVGAFDAAFTSRIHVALHYRRLTDEDRLKVWMNNFERLERDSAGKCYVPHAARSFVYESDDVRALNWNGREIRNALQTAVALAETEALEAGLETVTVTDKHLRAVVKMSKGFKDFLSKRRGCWPDAEEGDDETDGESIEYESD